ARISFVSMIRSMPSPPGQTIRKQQHMNNADEQQDRPTLLAQWLLTLYPLASLYQWSRVGVVLLTVGSMLQVTFAIGSMVLIASLADSTASGDLTRPLTGIVLLILCSQLLDAVSAACNRVVAAD